MLELIEKSREIKFGIILTPERMGEGLLFLLAVAALLPGLGYLRNSLLQPTILREGVDYQSAVARFRQLKGALADDEYILISEFTSRTTDVQPLSSMVHPGVAGRASGEKI